LRSGSAARPSQRRARRRRSRRCGRRGRRASRRPHLTRRTRAAPVRPHAGRHARSRQAPGCRRSLPVPPSRRPACGRTGAALVLLVR
jgi:hypothetical protein